jgi:hypothetical protein
MSYDAGFMLYASLEAARPIANGKMAPASANLPVLSGVCVASAAYLDKPSKAAYFIFPDLSVRHEGWYRLKFSLFEQVKNALDADRGREFVDDRTSNGPLPHEAMANRMEVVSKPFQVFSAKKFPGLDQSTDVSQVLASQGCRVRIRREIRQRKRTSDDHVKPEPRNETPEFTFPGHSRATSRNSNRGPQSPHDLMRRPSNESMYQAQQVQSRVPSLATTMGSISHASPITPTTPSMHSMPPPYRGYEQSAPQPAPYQSQYPNYFSQGSANVKYEQPSSPARNSFPETGPRLAPIQTHAPPPPSPASRHLYHLPEPTATKRTSSKSFNDDYAMKRGTRPDQPPQPASYSNNDIIEADNGEEDPSDREPLEYNRANGTRGMRIANLLL